MNWGLHIGFPAFQTFKHCCQEYSDYQSVLVARLSFPIFWKVVGAPKMYLQQTLSILSCFSHPARLIYSFISVQVQVPVFFMFINIVY